jgi:phage terminase small subunit
MTKEDQKLTPKQQLFVDSYANPASDIFGNATQAWINAGYSTNGATQNSCLALLKPHIKKAIEKYKEEITSNNIITSARLDKELFEVLKDCKAEKDRPNQLRALDLIGKRIGAYSDKIITEQVDTPTFSKEELAIYKDAAREIGIKISTRQTGKSAQTSPNAPGCPTIDFDGQTLSTPTPEGD